VDVAITRHGPFQRISFTRRYQGSEQPAQLSVCRVGDTLFDTGGSLTADALVSVLRDRPPRRIVCTHQHEDHVGGVGALRAAFGALPVLVPAAHVALLRTFERVPEYRARHWGHPRPIVDADGYAAGDVFEIDGVRLHAVDSPGHTPGHLTLVAHDGDRAFALTGDLYTRTPFVAWFESSAPCLLRSCRSLAQLAAQVTMIPTHGRVRDEGREALLDLAAKVEPLCEQVVHAASAQSGPSDYFAIAERVFGQHIEQGQGTVGEWSHACFVRSVLDPIVTLPATPLLPAQT
jgi:glyoxylase-like metal-dependent hydrolase (beta-lactamase superfamily II)